MSLVQWLESWAEGLLRVVIGGGLTWIGVVEGAGYGLFMEGVGVIFVAAGVAEIWFVDTTAHAEPRRASNPARSRPAPHDVRRTASSRGSS